MHGLAERDRFTLNLVHGSENHLLIRLHKVRRAAHPHGASIEHMGLDHRGAHVLVAQELLDRADVLAPLQQVGRKGMAEGVAAGLLGDSCLGYGSLHRLLHHARIQVVAALGAGFLVAPAILPSGYSFSKSLRRWVRVRGGFCITEAAEPCYH